MPGKPTTTVKVDPDGERIINISFSDGTGCLISVRDANGIRIVDVYRADVGIRVYAGNRLHVATKE